MGKLREYGGRMIKTDGVDTVELRDPNDNANKLFQYRGRPDGGLERRVLMEGGVSFPDGSPWETLSASEVQHLRSVRGRYHPILDPLGF